MTIQLQEHPARERRAEIAQRFGLGAMALVVLVALLGGFGPGPLGVEVARTSAGLRVEYDHFVRVEAPATLKLHLPAGSHEFVLDQRWLERVHVENVTPEPVRVTSIDGGLRYTMPKTRSAHAIQFHFEPDSWGRLEGSLGLAGEPPVHISQFAYP